MKCRYVWQTLGGEWVRCENDEHENGSHDNGDISVSVKRELTWPHHWVEHDEKITTREIPINDTVNYGGARDI